MPPPSDRSTRPGDFDEGPRRRPRRSDDRYREDDDDRPRRRRSEETTTSVMAIMSLVFGLLSFVFCGLTGLPAMILGVLGLVVIGRSGGQIVGKGFAITGLLLGTLSVAATAAVVPFVYWKVEEEKHAQKETLNLKQMGLAMHNYHDSNNSLPPAVTATRDGKPGLSWRVLLLPYLEQGSLYKQFKLDEPWDSPHNMALLNKMPDVYRSPSDPKGTSDTPYRVFVSKDAPFANEEAPFSSAPQWVADGPQPFPLRPGVGRWQMSLMRITDGTSNTFCVVEASQKVPWTKPDELEFSMNGSMPSLGYGTKDYFLVVMFDGSVRRISKGRTSDQTLRQLVNPNDGMVMPGDW